MFLGFANFYCCFIQGFSKIAGPLTSILKTSNSSKNFLNKIVEDDEVVGRSNNSGQNLAELKKLKNHPKLSKPKKPSHPKLSQSKKTILNKSEILVNSTVAVNADATRYLTPKARKAFT